MAYLQALGDLDQDLEASNPKSTFLVSKELLQNWSWSVEPIRFEDDRPGFFHRPKSLAQEGLIRSFASTCNKLSKLTSAEWSNFAENVRRNPRFLSGEPKPETQLFAFLILLGGLGRKLSTASGDTYRNHVQQWRSEIRQKISPKATDRDERIRRLVQERNAARKAKNFTEADRIRDELAAMGIELKDAKDPKTGELVTTWEVAR